MTSPRVQRFITDQLEVLSDYWKSSRSIDLEFVRVHALALADCATEALLEEACRNHRISA